MTFMDHKVMHLDRRHRANPSNHAAQTTAHCSPEACCYSCCLITFSRSGAERHSEYQKGRKAVLLSLWKSSVRSNIQLAGYLMDVHSLPEMPSPSVSFTFHRVHCSPNINSDLSKITELVKKIDTFFAPYYMQTSESLTLEIL